MTRAVPGAVVAIAALLTAASATPTPGALPKPPTAAVCVPKTIRMEYFSSLGAKLGEYDAKFQSLTRIHADDPYNYKCLWYASAPGDEAFIVTIAIAPAGTPGRVAAGNCDRTRKDSHPFYNSRKRYLGVSGGVRKYFQNALGGDATVLKSVLAAAEAAGVGQACPGTKPKPPPPPPSPKPKPPPPAPPPLPPSTGNLAIDYTMPDRFGLAGKRRLIEYHDTIEEIRPDELFVDFEVTRKDGRRCADGDILAISVDGQPLTPNRLTRTSLCKARASFPKEGTYRIRARLKTSGGVLIGERSIVVQDWLIVGLGDSNGSGEATPDIPAFTDPASKLPRWQNRQCHRSANSYQAQTALALEDRDPSTSITFLHLACSGATTLKGLLFEYEGIEEGLGPDLPPQIAEMKRLVGNREIDAVMISIGVNDLRFGAMVGHCIDYDDCPNAEFPEPTSRKTLTQEIVRLLRLLPNRYAKVGAALQGAGAAPERVHLSEYFDSTRDDSEAFCSPLIRVLGKGTFDRDEAKWAHDRVLVKLNQAVVAASGANEWGGPIRGAYTSFRKHGYCANDSWIVPLTGSFFGQLNKEGSLHATRKGNKEQAKDATLVLRKDFYAGDRTRRPSP